MHLPKHPNTDETIDSIINLMVPTTFYTFHDLWEQSFGVLPEEGDIYRERSLECFKIMMKNDLISVMGRDFTDSNLFYTHQFVKLTKKGVKVREDGGWLKTKGKSSVFIKIVHWATHINTIGDAIGKLSILVLLVIAGLKGRKYLQQELQGTTIKTKQPVLEQIIKPPSNYVESDSISTDSTAIPKK